jgi:hypothetical protein
MKLSNADKDTPQMTKTYLIAYGENPNDRLTAIAFSSRRAASRVVADLPEVRHLVSRPDHVETLLPGRALVEVYNGLTGESVSKFPRRSDGARRLFAALPRVAREEPAAPPSPVPPVRRPRGRGAVAVTTTTNEDSTRRFATAAEARGKGIELTKDHRINLLVNENPKRGAAAERFARYVNGMSVEEARAVGITTTDIRWDVAHDHIQLDPPQ